jgi:hypothetical protein
MFNNLFYYEESPMTNTAFKFFYFRTSPRGNTKFGVMDIPWQRLRMQQQGTDEEIQFDHIWLVRSLDGSWAFDFIERKLKDRYKNYCLAESNKRAGHTEWFSEVNIRDFQRKFKEFCKEYDVELKKVRLKGGYTATKKSQCPLRSPETYKLTWYDEFWSKIPQ